jgi:hypothetical protein
VGHIIWIASYPNSGDRSIGVFLNNLIVAGDEPHDMDDLSVTPRENFGAFYQPFFDRPPCEVSLPELAEKRPLVHRTLAERTEGFLLVRTHFLVARHFGTSTVTPEATAGAVYIVRNPLDVAVAEGDILPGGIEEAIGLLNTKGRILERPRNGSYQLAGSWSENVDSWTRKPQEKLHVIKYEDLVEDPKKQLMELVRFLAMDASEEQIDRAISQSKVSLVRQIEKIPAYRTHPEETLQSFHSGLKNRWQKRLTTAQVSAVVAAHLQTMLRFGYWE